MHGKIVDLPSRFVGWLTINRVCNLRCQWCYAKMKGFSRKDNMTLETVEAAVKVYKDLPMENVILIGGDPTVHPQLVEIIRMIRENGLKPLLLTNSLKLANKEFLERTIEAGLEGVCTSLKAGTAKEYLSLTGVDALVEIERAMQNIQATGIDHKVSVTVCRPILHSFEEIIQVVKRNQIRWFSIEFERPVIYRDKVETEGTATPQELVDFCLRIYPKLIKAKVDFNIRISLPFCRFPENFIKTLIENQHITSGCQIFNGVGVIFDPEGKVLPCGHFCNHSIGQLGVDFSTAAEYYEFRKREEITDFYNAFNFCPSQQCVDCRYWEQCGAGCRVRWVKGILSEELLGDFRMKGGEKDGQN